MPRYWYDKSAIKLPDNPSEEDIAKHEFNLRIVADRKPYFMRYIYPNLMSDYNTYIKNTNTKCMREFRRTVDELLEIPEEERTEEQNAFLSYYWKRMPVGMNNCVMNRICVRFEREFDSKPFLMGAQDDFNPAIMKNGIDYSRSQYLAVEKVFHEHNKRLQERMKLMKKKRSTEDDEMSCYHATMIQYFKEECFKICSSSKTLCDIVIDICYSRSGTRQFVWDVVCDEVIDNLLAGNGHMLRYPRKDAEGDIFYSGNRFSMAEMEVYT